MSVPPWQLKLATAALATAGAWAARAYWRRRAAGALNPWTWLCALSFQTKLALFLLFPMWFGSFALSAFLFGAVFSEGLAACVVKNAPAAAKVYGRLHPALKDTHEK